MQRTTAIDGFGAKLVRAPYAQMIWSSNAAGRIGLPGEDRFRGLLDQRPEQIRFAQQLVAHRRQGGPSLTGSVIRDCSSSRTGRS